MDWKARAGRVLLMRVGLVYVTSVILGMELHRSSQLPRAEALRYSVFFFLFLLAASVMYEWRGRRQPLWRVCLEGIAAGYVSGLCAQVALDLTTPNIAGLLSAAREPRLVVRFMLLPVSWLSWIDGALLGWFTWVSE